MSRRKAALGKKRWLWLAVGLLAAVAALVLFTKPQQLPARLADHETVRKVYSWADMGRAAVHDWRYPLADLREDAPLPPTAGPGYTDKDRDRLDTLIEKKETP